MSKLYRVTVSVVVEAGDEESAAAEAYNIVGDPTSVVEAAVELRPIRLRCVRGSKGFGALVEGRDYTMVRAARWPGEGLMVTLDEVFGRWDASRFRVLTRVPAVGVRW